MINKNLQRYRLLAGLTQSALAEAAGISRNAYRKVETGETEPRFDTLKQIASALEVDVQDLMQQVKGLQQVRFRALKGSRATRQREAGREHLIHSTAIWLDRYNELERMLSAEMQVPSWMEQTYRSPAEAAQHVRHRLSVCRQCPVVQICDLLEEKVKFRHFDSDMEKIFGFSVGPADRGPVIAVNVSPKISVERVIFTAAHELGHLVLHLNGFDSGEATKESDEEEKEANEFAGQFLMPDELFAEAWHHTRGIELFHRVMKIKHQFFVSYQAVLHRLVSLSLANSEIWFVFNGILKDRLGPRRKYEEPMKLSDEAYAGHNWRRANEAHALDAHVFWEDRLDNLVRQALEDHVLNLGQAAELLEIKLDQMRDRRKTWQLELSPEPHTPRSDIWDSWEKRRQRFGPLTEEFELPPRDQTHRPGPFEGDA